MAIRWWMGPLVLSPVSYSTVPLLRASILVFRASDICCRKRTPVHLSALANLVYRWNWTYAVPVAAYCQHFPFRFDHANSPTPRNEYALGGNRNNQFEKRYYIKWKTIDGNEIFRPLSMPNEQQPRRKKNIWVCDKRQNRLNHNTNGIRWHFPLRTQPNACVQWGASSRRRNVHQFLIGGAEHSHVHTHTAQWKFAIPKLDCSWGLHSKLRICVKANRIFFSTHVHFRNLFTWNRQCEKREKILNLNSRWAISR